MIKAVVATSILDDVQALLEAQGPVEVELVGVDADGNGGDLSDADAAIRWDLDDAGFRRVLDRAPHLRWVHSPGAGVEKWPLDELASREVVLTNAAGIFAIPIAEWVLSTMLTVVNATHAVREAQRDRRWATDIPTDELYGKTVLVLGSGGIGQETITRAAAFGMTVIAFNRRGREVEHADRTVQGDAWRDVLGEADFVVSTLPLTPETEGMIGVEELRLFKTGAWLINVGRGATIDEPALVAALQDGFLGGAALDAWTVEPLPADDPAWTLPTMIVSPHMSGNSPAGRGRGLRLFADNLVRFAGGEPLVNQVDYAAGY